MSGHELIFCLEWSKNFTQFEKEMGELVFFDQISLISKIGIANAKTCSGKDTKYGYIMRDLGWVAHFFCLNARIEFRQADRVALSKARDFSMNTSFTPQHEIIQRISLGVLHERASGKQLARNL